MARPRPQLIIISAEHEAVGGTIATTVKVGETILAEYMPGTSHMSRAQDIVERIVADALRPLILKAIADDGSTLRFSDE